MNTNYIQVLDNGGQVIETFALDVTSESTHVSSLQVTTNPVESGGRIADHIVVDPDSVTVSGLVVTYERPDAFRYPVPGVPFPISQDVVAGLFNGRLNTITEDVAWQLEDDRISQFVGLAANELNNAVAPWLPDAGALFGLDQSSDNLRLQQKYSRLRQIQRSGNICRVVTDAYVYDSMLMTGVNATLTRNSSLKLVLNFQQYIFVPPQQVTSQGLTGGNAYTKAAETAKGKGKKGDNSPTGDGTALVKDKTRETTPHTTLKEDLQGRLNAIKQANDATTSKIRKNIGVTE